MGWKEGALVELCTLKRGHDLPSAQRVTGTVPIYSSSGITGYHEQAKCSGPGVIMGRYGTIGEVFFSKNDYWPLNTTLYVENFHGNDEKFVYFFLKTLDWEKFNDKSAVPGINRNDVHKEVISFPEVKEQRAIAAVLSSLDDKIDLLHRQNATLEAMAEALFKQWFVVEAKEEWEETTIEEAIIFYDNQRIPLSQTERDKKKTGELYPYYGAAQIMDYINEYIFDGDYLLIAEDGTVRNELGFPILQRTNGKFWVNNHTHIIQAKQPYTNDFIYIYLLKKNIDEIITGAVQPKISQGNLKKLQFFKYPHSLVLEYNNRTKPYFEKICSNRIQINTIEKLRDTLLPKLMSGEVRVDC